MQLSHGLNEFLNYVLIWNWEISARFMAGERDSS